MFNPIFHVRPEPQMEFKDNLYKVNIWLMRVILLVSFIFIGFYEVNTTISGLTAGVPLVQSMSPAVFYPLMHVMTGVLNVVMFELIGSIYYSFIRPICPPVNLTRKGFMVYLRVAYVVRNVVCGILNLIFLFGDLYFFVFSQIISLVVTTAVLAVAYFYVNKNYVPDKMKAPFLKLVAVPYFVVQFVGILAGLL